MSLIRTYKLTEKIPTSKLLSVLKEIKPNWRKLNTNWLQTALYIPPYYEMELGSREEIVGSKIDNLRKWFISQCPIKRTEHASIIVHRIIGDVSRHTDCMSKSCFLFPIKIGKNVWLGVEDKEIRLEVGKMYRFNDFNDHYMASGMSTNIIVTVDFSSW